MKSSPLLVRERIQSNLFITSVCRYTMFVHRSVALKNNIQTDALCKSLVFSLQKTCKSLVG